MYRSNCTKWDHEGDAGILDLGSLPFSQCSYWFCKIVYSQVHICIMSWGEQASIVELFSEIIPHGTRLVIFIDDGFLELLKWKNISTDSNASMLLPLSSLTSYDEDCLQVYRPDTAIFLSNLPLKQSQSLILQATQYCLPQSYGGNLENVLVLTTTTPEAMAPSSSKTQLEQSGYIDFKSQLIQLGLDSSKVSIVYFPVHSFPIIPPSSQPPSLTAPPTVDAFVLNNGDCRVFHPLSLSSLGMWNHWSVHAGGGAGSGDSFNSSTNESGIGSGRQAIVNDIEVEHIPSKCRHHMRVLAHELAGALVYNYHVDCSQHIFTCGKTSEFIGFTLQPIIESLLKHRMISLQQAHSNSISGGGGTSNGIKASLESKAKGGIRSGVHKENTRIIDVAQRVAMRWGEASPLLMSELYGQSVGAGAGGVGTTTGDAGVGEEMNEILQPEKASLLLIDRTCDLFTPSITGTGTGTGTSNTWRE
jgi:hypothetical protein